MAELTDREKTLVHTMYYMMNPQMMAIPIDDRVVGLQLLLKVRKINFTLDELKDFTHAIEDERKLSISEGMGWINKNRHLIQGFDDLRL